MGTAPRVHTQVQVLQERQLQTKAFAERRFYDLLYFNAALRRMEAIRALKDELDPARADDILMYELLTGEAREAAALIDLWTQTGDVWLSQRLISHLLRTADLRDAVLLVRRCLEHDPHNLYPLRLLGWSLAARGERDLALSMLDRLLQLGPIQNDVERFRRALQDGERHAWTPPKDAFPPPEAVSFYLPVYNVEAFIRSAIEGILAQNHPLREILVVDDGSPDNSIAIAREYPVRVLDHGGNKGLAAARNTAFRNASTPLLASVDTDACPDTRFTQYALLEFEEAGPSMAGVGGRLIEMYTGTPADMYRSIHMRQHWGDVRVCSPIFLFGSNAVFRVDTVRAAGGFNEIFRTNTEDVDLCIRLRERGCDLAYTPYAAAHHMRRDTLDTALHTQWQWEFWARDMQGTYKDLDSLLKAWITDIAINAQTLGTHAIEHPAILYLDFLSLFYRAFCDMRHGAAIGVLEPGQALAMRTAMVETVRLLDARFTGPLCPIVSRHLRVFETTPAPCPALPGASFNDYLATLSRYFETLSRDQYDGLVACAELLPD